LHKDLFLFQDEYQQKKIPGELSHGSYVINEGGYGIKGAEGAATIMDYCNKENYTHICCAVGTGTMAAGLVMAAAGENRIVAVSIMKNNPEIGENINQLSKKSNIKLIHDYPFGGYAKHDSIR